MTLKMVTLKQRYDNYRVRAAKRRRESQRTAQNSTPNPLKINPKSSPDPLQIHPKSSPNPPQGAPWGPLGKQALPRLPKRAPKARQRQPKSDQKRPKGDKDAPKGRPKSPKSMENDPRGASWERDPKKSPKSSKSRLPPTL